MKQHIQTQSADESITEQQKRAPAKTKRTKANAFSATTYEKLFVVVSIIIGYLTRARLSAPC